MKKIERIEINRQEVETLKQSIKICNTLFDMTINNPAFTVLHGLSINTCEALGALLGTIDKEK